MEEVKAKRRGKELKIYLAACLPHLDRVYNAFLASLPIAALQPSLALIMKDPTVRRAIEGAPRRPDYLVDYLDWTSLFRGAVARWERLGEENLATLVSNARGDQSSFEPASVLNMATTWFACSNCHLFLRYPHALLHSCLAEGDHTDVNVFDAAVAEVFMNTRLPNLALIGLSLEDCDFMAKVVALCGFEPKIATAEELEAASPIIECVSCNDPQIGRAHV